MQARRNILIFHAGALGDFVVTWPLALALARVHPQSRLFYVSQRGKGALAERVLRLESADSEAGWHALYTPGGTPPEAQAKLLAGAHSVISFVSTPGDEFSAGVGRLSSGVNYLPMTVSPPADFKGHVSDYLMAQLAAWPAAHGALEQVLRSVAARGVMNRPAPGRAIVVHPGSGSRRKCWPAARYVQLIERLRNAGHPVRVAVGEVERETWSPGEIDRIAAAAELVRPESYVDLFDELLAARAYIGNDSGPSHLAGIIGVPTVALFGPSNAEQWHPLGPRVRVVRGASMEEIAVEHVAQEVQRAINS
jgi:ADP-heptose:LPS heptosyltransferase